MKVVRTHTFLLLVGLLGLLILLTRFQFLAESTYRNIINRRLAQVWLSDLPRGFNDRAQVRDDLPDFWTASNWGHSTQIEALASAACEGEGSAYIHKTNPLGAAAYYQIVAVRPETGYDLSICAKGQGAEILIRPYRPQSAAESSQSAEPTFRYRIPPSDSWQTVEFNYSTPPNTEHVQIWLASYLENSENWFDQFSFGEPGQKNLIANPGFEMDGRQPDLEPAALPQPITFVRAGAAKLLSADEQSRYAAQEAYLSGDEQTAMNEINQLKISSPQDAIRTLGWLIGEGQRNYSNGFFESAQNNFQLLQASGLSHPLIALTLARIFNRTGSSQLAIDQYLRVPPQGYPRIAYELALVYLNDMKDYASAKEYLSIARQDPNLSADIENILKARYAIGQALLDNHHADEALMEFVFITGLVPEDSDLYQMAIASIERIQSAP